MSREAELEELRAKVAALTTIAEAKASDGSKEFLEEVLSKLKPLRENLVAAHSAHKELARRCAELEARNAELETLLEKRDYQILHLSRNLREAMK